MLVYRIGHTRHANSLTGDGARLVGGRWNNKGVPCIYTSESRALAFLEYSCHAIKEFIPRDLSFTTFEIPNDLVTIISIGNLPGNWNKIPNPKEPQNFGTSLLTGNTSLIYRFPSVVIEDEFNYLIDPLHKDMHLVKLVNVTSYAYDLRVKSN